ncbi:MAG: HEAT repeat domain-containing protein [candidate division Zixibacteria bacterium]|nr:HEAT repeat domain-containing protein [candidate division Zixibacteria bacterium]
MNRVFIIVLISICSLTFLFESTYSNTSSQRQASNSNIDSIEVLSLKIDSLSKMVEEKHLFNLTLNELFNLFLVIIAAITLVFMAMTFLSVTDRYKTEKYIDKSKSEFDEFVKEYKHEFNEFIRLKNEMEVKSKSLIQQQIGYSYQMETYKDSILDSFKHILPDDKKILILFSKDIANLGHPDSRERFVAINNLSRKGDLSVIPYLRNVENSDPDPERRQDAALAIQDIENRETKENE